MAASKVARKRQGSLPKEPPPIINGEECKEYALDSFEIIKTIGQFQRVLMAPRPLPTTVLPSTSPSCPYIGFLLVYMINAACIFFHIKFYISTNPYTNQKHHIL